MEEKEIYGITDDHYLCDSAIFNTVTNERLRLYQICDLLNQQSKRIKELEEKLKNYKLCRCVDCSSEYEKGLETSIDELEKENQQLEQKLHDLPKKIAEEIKKVSDTTTLGNGDIFDYTITAKNLDTILKKYGGEDA